MKDHTILRSSEFPKELELLLMHAAPTRKTTIVDVGANPVNLPPYDLLRRLDACNVVGFEPEETAFAELEKARRHNETNFNLAVGDGRKHTLNLYVNEYMTSIFEPNLPGLAAVGMSRRGRVRGSVVLDTVSLDTLPGLPEFDLLKIDVQGAENLVFEGARQKLQSAVAVIVELRYHRLYLNEPMLGTTDQELTEQGFCLHKFMFNKSKVLSNSQASRLKRRFTSDQLIDGDAVYLRNITEPAKLTSDQIKHMAILGCAVFGSHSLALYCLDELVRRQEVSDDLPRLYVDALPMAMRRE